MRIFFNITMAMTFIITMYVAFTRTFYTTGNVLESNTNTDTDSEDLFRPLFKNLEMRADETYAIITANSDLLKDPVPATKSDYPYISNSDIREQDVKTSSLTFSIPDPNIVASVAMNSQLSSIYGSSYQYFLTAANGNLFFHADNPFSSGASFAGAGLWANELPNTTAGTGDIATMAFTPGDATDPVDNTVPIDGGLSVLLAAGIGVSIRSYQEKKQVKAPNKMKQYFHQTLLLLKEGFLKMLLHIC